MLTPNLPPDLVLPESAGLEADLTRAVGPMFEQIVAAMPLGLIAIDPQGLVRLWNAASERMFGWTRDEVVGRPPPSVPPSLAGEFHDVLHRALERPINGVDLVRVRKDGTVFDMRLWTSRIVTSSGAVVAVLGVMSDETQRRQEQQALAQKTALIELLQDVTIAANESDSIEPAVERALTRICRYLHWPLGHALLVDPKSRQLHSSRIWCSSGEEKFPEFRRVTEDLTYASGPGLVGQVLANGRAVWSDALDRHADPRRIGATAAAGLVTGLAFPVLVGSEVAGVVEFFHTEKVPVDPLLLELLHSVGTQLGRVIERNRAQQERLALIEQAQRAEEEAIAAKRRLVLEKLSAREQDVMRFLAIGADNLKIAAHLGITERTVKAHITSLLRKLHLENRTQIAVLALGIGVAGPGELPAPAPLPPDTAPPEPPEPPLQGRTLVERAR